MKAAEVWYVDTSILARAYFPDEVGHDDARVQVFQSDVLALTSSLSHVELTSAVRAAARADRITDPDELLGLIRADFAPGGPVVLIGLKSGPTLRRARQLCDRHRLRALDAIHLAVALAEASRFAEGLPLAFATVDADQAEAARREGLRVEMP